MAAIGLHSTATEMESPVTNHWWIDALAVTGVAVVLGIPAAFGVWGLVDVWRGRNRPQHRKTKEEQRADDLIPE